MENYIKKLQKIMEGAYLLNELKLSELTENLKAISKLAVGAKMGRYYSGDINGKFWFGVQSSDDSEFFGGNRQEPSYVTYVFDEGDIETVREGIQVCKEKLGTYHKPIHDFFRTGEGKNGYNEEMIMKALNIDGETTDNILAWYARLQLGGKIYECLKEKGYCEFDAEF